MTVPFTAGMQEQKSNIDRAEQKEILESCVYEWDCFDYLDIYEETVLVNLYGLLSLDFYTKCRGADPGVGSVFLGGRRGLEQLSSFHISGLDLVWRFGGDSESKSYDYMVLVEPDGTGLYYDFSNAKEGESVKPSQIYSCVDRSDEAVIRMIGGFENSDEVTLEPANPNK